MREIARKNETECDLRKSGNSTRDVRESDNNNYRVKGKVKLMEITLNAWPRL